MDNCAVCCEDNLKTVSSRIYITSKECNIHQIIEKHLGWWQSSQYMNNGHEPWICLHCYHEITSFHNFYVRAENNNRNRSDQIKFKNATEIGEKLIDAVMQESTDSDNEVLPMHNPKRIKTETDNQNSKNIQMDEFTIVDIKTEPDLYMPDQEPVNIIQEQFLNRDSITKDVGIQTNFITLDVTDFRDELKGLFNSELKTLRRSIQYDKSRLVEQLVVLPGADNSKKVSDFKNILNLHDPFYDLQTFYEFDNKLRIDQEFLDALRQLITIKIRTKSLSDAIGAVVSMIITPELQMRFSACGKPTKGISKENFSATKTYIELKDYLLSQFNTESEASVLSKTSRWFAAAKDRYMGRKAR